MKIVKSVQIKVTGLVQGVGFRPFIYRLAVSLNLKGNVENTNEGVIINVEGNQRNIKKFLQSIRAGAPVASVIADISVSECDVAAHPDFQIFKSHSLSQKITEVSPDIAVCEDCLADLKVQPHRINYPFINCTNCGPRFSIIRDLPYDRENTSMQVFPMCEKCKKEYETISDRRFHAQPVACSLCGPEYCLRSEGEEIRGVENILERLTQMLKAGKIIAMKGTGGFHLACDALNNNAVRRLRELKNREGKPFAVMFSDLETLKQFSFVVSQEEQSLLSWRRPVVLLRLKDPSGIAPEVSRGLNSIGAMLPYMPFHYLIFRSCDLPAMVLTSGNLSDEPIIIGNDAATDKFSGIVDGILDYNREIENRTDDSVVKIIQSKERVFRRSRGYAPSPIRVKFDAEGIIATGGEKVNCFCMGKGNMAILSQHIGDLKNIETSDFYEETFSKYMHLFRLKPSLIVTDLHPEYYSTKFADRYRDQLAVVRVQHHHAHIGSCMAEYNLDEKVIGIAMDGTGYGDDGHIWGAEFFICDLNEYQRFSHFEYIPLPGGDRATEEPWRMAVSYLYASFGEQFLELDIPFLKRSGRQKVRKSLSKEGSRSEVQSDFSSSTQQFNNSSIHQIIKMIKSGINSPLVSSAGRLFDAVAAILGICEVATFQAEGPMRLESLVDPSVTGKYDFEFKETISFLSMIRQIVSDIQSGCPLQVIATKFHNSLISSIFDMVMKMNSETGLKKVVLSGGTFQNKYLLEGIETRLLEHGFEIFSHCKVPTNDGGIALGQLAIAAKRRELKCV